MLEMIEVMEQDVNTRKYRRMHRSRYIRLEVENGEYLHIKYENGAWYVRAGSSLWVEMEGSNALHLRDRHKTIADLRGS